MHEDSFIRERETRNEAGRVVPSENKFRIFYPRKKDRKREASFRIFFFRGEKGLKNYKLTNSRRFWRVAISGKSGLKAVCKN